MCSRKLMLAMIAALFARGGAAFAQSHDAAPAAVIVAQDDYRSAGLAAALSLTPMPVDFGNFYAENPQMGVVWTAAETGLMAAAMWSSWDGGMMGHNRDGAGSRTRWTAADRDRTVALGVAYVGVKLVSALQASQSASAHNERLARVQAGVLPTGRGAVAVVVVRF